MFKTFKADLNAYLERDPAARNKFEIFFLYSGYKAVRSHRRAYFVLLMLTWNRYNKLPYFI